MNLFKRGDVVTLWSPQNKGLLTTKRIVALEGDLVSEHSFGRFGDVSFSLIPRAHSASLLTSASFSPVSLCALLLVSMID